MVAAISLRLVVGVSCFREASKVRMLATEACKQHNSTQQLPLLSLKPTLKPRPQTKWPQNPLQLHSSLSRLRFWWLQFLTNKNTRLLLLPLSRQIDGVKVQLALDFMTVIVNKRAQLICCCKSLHSYRAMNRIIKQLNKTSTHKAGSHCLHGKSL